MKPGDVLSREGDELCEENGGNKYTRCLFAKQLFLPCSGPIRGKLTSVRALGSPVFHSPQPPTPQSQGAQSREPGVLHTRGSPHTSEPLHRLFPLLAMPFLTLSFWRTSTQPSQTNSNNNPRTPLHHCPKLKRWPLFWVHSSPCKRLNRDLVT